MKTQFANTRFSSVRFVGLFLTVTLLMLCNTADAQPPGGGGPGGGGGGDCICMMDAAGLYNVRLKAGHVDPTVRDRFKFTTEDLSGTGQVPNVSEVKWKDTGPGGGSGTFQPNFFGVTYVDVPGGAKGAISVDVIWTDANGNPTDCDDYEFQCPDLTIAFNDPAPPDPTNDPGPPITDWPGNPDPCQTCGGNNGMGGDSTTWILRSMLSNGVRDDYSFCPATGGGCSAGNCGGAVSGGTVIPGIFFQRLLIPNNQVTVGNCSPGMFFSFDLRLQVFPDGLASGQHAATFFDPVSQHTFYYEDTNGDGTYEPELGTYFGAFTLEDSNGTTVSDPSDVDTQQVFAVLTRHNGMKYRFELVDSPVYDTEPLTPLGRLESITTPQGHSIDFTYKTFTQTQLEESPRRMLQIDTISDGYGNSASITYNSAQQAGRWVISDVNINTNQDTLEYLYNTNGHLETVNRNSVLKSSYTYGTDTLWQAATIAWYEKNDQISEVETLYLSQDYREWDNQLVNQYANAIVGRADGAGDRYMSVSRHATTPDLYRIYHRGELIQWSRGSYVRYFESFTQSGSGYDSYSGTLESTYAHHPVSSAQQILEAQHPTLVTTSGYTTTQTYDANGNPSQTTYPDSSYELRQHNSINAETYFRDRGGFVTLTEYDSNFNVVRVARGLKDVSGPGTETAEPEAAQTIYGYYSSGHQNEGLMQWSATVDYVAGAIVAPPVGERTDYIYDSNNRLLEVHKPIPNGQTVRPVVKNVWVNGKLDKTINVKNLATQYDYDDLGRLIETAYPDGSTEQVLRDDSANQIFRKNRNNIVDRQDFDTAGRAKLAYTAYAIDADLHDGNALDTLNSSNEYSTSNRWYNASSVIPWRTQRNSTDTFLVYDYRSRLTSTKTRAHTGANAYQQQDTIYVDNLVFSTESIVDGYTRREYIGRSADQLTVRKIACRIPTVTFADNTAVMNATRLTGLDPDRTVIDAVRDVRGNLVQTINANDIETRTEFDALGRQKLTTQAYGTTIALSTSTQYDAMGNVTQSTDAAGTKTVMQYDPAGNVKSRKLAEGVAGVEMEYLYEYHKDGRQMKETLPSGGVNESFFEDCCGNTQGNKDPYGHGQIANANAGGQTTHTAIVQDYDDHTNLENPIDAKTLGETTTKYRADGNVQFRTVWKSALGLIDIANPPIAGIDGVSASDGVTTQYVYLPSISSTAASSQKVTVDKLGGGTFEIDISSAITKLDDTIANGGASIDFGQDSTFQARGSASIVISPDEKSMNISISDGTGRTVMTALMSGPKAATGNQLLNWNCVQHDQVESLAGFGDVLTTKQIDRDGEFTRNASDGFGWSVASWDQNSKLTRTKFDSAGNAREIINALSKTTTNVYDDLGRLVSTTDPLTHSTSTQYNPTTGRVDSQTDARGNKTEFEVYDALGRVKQIKDRMGKVSYKAYDTAGNLDFVTDAEGNITDYDYDLLGRRTELEMNDINGATPQKTVYKYDPAGRMEWVTLHKGDKREMKYEFAGMLDKVEYFDSTGTLKATDDFAYNDPGTLRRTGSTSSDGVTHSYTYSERGQLDTDTTTYSSQSYVVDYGYDDEGRMDKVTYPSGRVVDYTFTNRGELDTISWDGTQIEDRAYDDIGRMTNVDRAHVDEVRVYDDANRLTSIDNTNLGKATYGYDENNNKQSETWTGALAPWSFTTKDLAANDFPSGYDDEDRFRRFTQSSQSKDYDLVRSDVGNITNRKMNGTSQIRTFNEVYQLTDLAGSPQTYDDNGSLTTSHTGMTLAWQDGNSRLAQTVVPSGATAGIEGTNDYGYDADNKRIWKKITRSGSTAEHTVYVYAGPNCIAEYDSGAAATSPKQEYVYGLEIDSLVMIAKNNNADRLTVLRNQQWSVSGLMNTTDGSIAELYSYDVFGKRTVLASNGTSVRSSSNYDNPYGFTTRRHDEESGLGYFRARIFDFFIGEFVSQDLLEDIDGNSIYRGYFVVNGTDPFGFLQQNDVVPRPPFSRDYPKDRLPGPVRRPRVSPAVAGQWTYKPRLVGGDVHLNTTVDLADKIGLFTYPLTWVITGSPIEGKAVGLLEADIWANDTTLFVTAKDYGAKVQHSYTDLRVGYWDYSKMNISASIDCKIGCSPKGAPTLTCDEENLPKEQHPFWAASYLVEVEGSSQDVLMLSATATSSFSIAGGKIKPSMKAGIFGASIDLPAGNIKKAATARMGIRSWVCEKCQVFGGTGKSGGTGN